MDDLVKELNSVKLELLDAQQDRVDAELRHVGLGNEKVQELQEELENVRNQQTEERRLLNIKLQEAEVELSSLAASRAEWCVWLCCIWCIPFSESSIWLTSLVILLHISSLVYNLYHVVMFTCSIVNLN